MQSTMRMFVSLGHYSVTLLFALCTSNDPIRLNYFLHYSIVQPQSLTPYFYKTKEYSDMSLYMGGKIRS